MNIWLYKYEAIKMWTYTNMRVYKYDATEIWGHKNMRLYKYEDKQPWGSTHMRLCKYETIQLLCFPCTQYTSWHGKWCLTWLIDILNWSAELCQRLCISTSCNLHQHLSADVNIILMPYTETVKNVLSLSFSISFFHKSCQVRVLFHVIHSHFVELQLQ